MHLFAQLSHIIHVSYQYMHMTDVKYENFCHYFLKQLMSEFISLLCFLPCGLQRLVNLSGPLVLGHSARGRCINIANV